MTTKNLFRSALENNETNDFFRGKGRYYSHNPMTGEHTYGIHLSGWVEKFLNSNEDGINEFENALQNFILSLEPNESDLESLLANLSEIVRLQKQGLLKGLNFTKSINSEILVATDKYLEKIKENGVYKENSKLIDAYISLIERNDGNIIASTLKEK